MMVDNTNLACAYKLMDSQLSLSHRTNGKLKNLEKKTKKRKTVSL